MKKFSIVSVFTLLLCAALMCNAEAVNVSDLDKNVRLSMSSGVAVAYIDDADESTDKDAAESVEESADESTDKDAAESAEENAYEDDYKDTDKYVVLKEDNVLYVGKMNDPTGKLVPVIDGVGSLEKFDSGYTANGISPCVIISEQSIPDWLSIKFASSDHSVDFIRHGVLLDNHFVGYVNKIPSMYSYVWEGKNHIVFSNSREDWVLYDDVHVDWNAFQFDT